MIPDIEAELSLPLYLHELSADLVDYLKANANELREKPVMRQMQEFLNMS